jgi:predicted flap endonuclease-1-like 5' DNA nuclease
MLPQQLSVLFLTGPLTAGKEAGNPWWIWLIVLGALAVFVAFVLWWWIYSPGSGEAEESGPTPHHATKASIAEIEPAPAVPDDLKLVEGIGPKIAAVLAGSGILTFAQLAGTEVERLRQILEEANPNLLRLADPSTWPQQARLAAEGAWEELEKLQDGLKGGRRA